MALMDENGGMIMPVAPMYGNGFGGNGGNGFGQDGWWVILLFLLLAANGGWGNNAGNGGGATYNVGMQRGFDQASVMGGLNGIQSGIQNISTQLCNSFANAETAANARQMASMQQVYGLSSQFADCCCENRLATLQTQNVVQSEANATRLADANNTRAILDKLCQLELDGKNDRIADLERQLTMANLAASQTAQTSRILADNAAQTVALEQYLNPTPIPAYMVQNPNCCQTNSCGCGNF